MKRSMLLPLLFAIPLSLGADCSGGSSSSGGSSAAASRTVFELDAPEPIEAERPGAPVPEPSAALIFGLGLLVAGVASRRSR